MKRARRVRVVLLAAVAGLLGFAAVSAFFAWRFTGPARRALRADPVRFLSSFETIQFPARDGVKLAGWFVPCAEAKCAVVLLHGFGSERTQMLARARLLHDHGYAVLLYDARGHGESAGELVSVGWFETRDLLGALDWLRARGFAEFGCLGESQGGATIALAAAQLRDVRWVVLESVYPTLRNAVDRRFRRLFYLPGWLLGSLMMPMAEWRLGVGADAISPRDHVRELHCPILVMSGDRDTHTLPDDAREVFTQAPEPKTFWLVPGAAHVVLYGFAKQDYETHLLGFLGQTPSARTQ